MPHIKASVIIVPENNKFQKFAAIYSPQKRFGYSLPGGKLNKNESAEKAAIRELYEETGIIAMEDNLIYLGGRKDKDKLVILYFVFPDNMYLSNTKSGLRDSKEGKAVWVKENDLIYGSSFKYWNIWAFNKMYEFLNRQL